MNRAEIKQVWAETIGADADWDAASTVAAYRPAPAKKAPPPALSGLPQAAFTTSPRLRGRQQVALVGPGVARHRPVTGEQAFDETLAATDAVADTDTGADTVAATDTDTDTDTDTGADTVAATDTDTDTDTGADTVAATDTDTLAAPVTAPTMPSTAAPTAAEGMQQYELQDEIGRGGMGVVYRATQGSLRRDVAVKTLIPGRGGGLAREQFVAEALVTGALDHPNVIPVHELGETGQGEVFLAMKLVRGHSWHDLLHPRTDAHKKAAEGWDQRRHVDVLISVCNAIAFAHSRGIAHRDLKPANIMVGDFGETMVMDWGISLDVREPRPEQPLGPHKDDATGPAGTPCYMAPEQAEARNRDIGPWTDVFQLGAMLHEVITGAPPHKGAQLMDVLHAASRAEPPTYDDDVPSALQAICRQAMARDPADRFADAAAFLAALRTWLGNAESLRLSDEGDRLLASLVAGEVAMEERYGLYARALSRHEQALHLWADNEPASRGQARAAIHFAEEALERGDAGLASAQLALLEGHRHADRPRCETTAMGVRRLGSGRLRAGIGAVVAIALALLIWQGLEEVTATKQAELKRREMIGALDHRATKAWQALATHDAFAATRALADFRETVAELGPRAVARGELLGRATRTLLWQQGRWEQLFGQLCRSSLQEHGSASMRGLLMKRPAIKNTSLSDRLRHGEGFVGSSTRLCRVLHEAIVAGDPVPAVLDALATIQREGGQPTAKDAESARLGRAAICALHPAAQVTATVAGGGCADGVPPFALLEPPFGALRQGLPVDAPRLSRTADGAWEAWDRRTGKRRWRTAAAPDGERSQLAVPVADGSIVFGLGAFLLRRDGLTGRVLARQKLPGVALHGWPDPNDRRRLVVAVWSLVDQGVVHLLRFRAGPEQPIFANDRVGSGWAAPKWLQNVRKQALEAGAARAGVDKDKAGDDPALKRLAAETVAALAKDDPLDPEIPLMVLQLLGKDADSARRAQLADRVVANSADMLPLHGTRIAAMLEREGFAGRADKLIDQAAEAAQIAGVNSELNASLIGNPAFVLRKLGDELWQQGKIERALQLVESGRAFADFIEYDPKFYRRWGAWLRQQGRPDTNGLVARRIRESAPLGAALLLNTFQVRLVDIALPISAAAPMILFILLIAMWWRPRKTRFAALHARGFRTRRQRLVAFLEHPVDRLRHTFPTYATRPQRLAVFGLALLSLLSAAILSANVTVVMRNANASLTVAAGHAGAPGCLEVLERRLETSGDSPSVLNLQAEGRYTRGQLDAARQTLDRLLANWPDSAMARNNLALLDEQAGDRDAARQGYERAAAGSGPGAESAAWNRDRLAGSNPAAETLPRRDRLPMERTGPDRPLWARCTLNDVRNLLNPAQDFGQAVAQSLAGLISGDTQAAFRVAGGDLGETISPARTLSSALGIWTLAVALLSLLWLPVRPLPIIPEPPPSPQPPGGPTEGLFRRLWRRSRAIDRTLSRVIGWLLPGWSDMFSGRFGLAALQLTGVTVFASIWLGTSRMGLVSTLVDYKLTKHYFGTIVDPGPGVGLDVAGAASLICLVLIYVVHLGRRVRAIRQRR